MKKICMIVFVVLATIMQEGCVIRHPMQRQVNAQVENDTTLAVQDTTDKAVNKPKVVPSKKDNKKNSADKNDCQECEGKLANAEKENKKLKKQVEDLDVKLGMIETVMDIDDRDFYRSLITTPLEKKYDSTQIEYYKKTALLFDHENKKEMKWVYEVYYPLLENYGKYNKDLAKLIQRVIKSFELIGIPDSKTEKELFNEGLEEMGYFKEYRYKRNISQEIKYLEDVINDTKMLFDNPSKFKKEGFEEQLRRLEK